MPYQFADFAENKILDWLLRAQSLPLPASNWHLALGSAGSDGGITELSGTGYARVAVPRTLAKWKSTQGDSLASTGTTHSTSNTDAISWGTPGSAWGTATHVGFFDASTSGNCWIWVPIEEIVITTGSPDPVELAAGELQLVLGLAGGMTDYLANKLIDLIWRGQSYTPPATLYFALFTAAPTNAGGGTEAAVSGYARASLTASMANMSGTQAPGSTSASSGTSGRSSNNVAIAFPALGAALTTAAAGIMDAATTGNLLFWGSLVKSFLSGLSPTFQPDKLGVTLD